MDKIVESIKQYLDETLRANIEVSSWKNQNSLPFFLITHYHFYQVSLIGEIGLLMISKGQSNTPGMIRKHWNQIQKYWDGPIIYVQSALSSHNRKRLIEQHIPFIIPGNQMYLPYMGIDLREYFRKTHSKQNKAFSPGTQAVVIYALLCKTNEKFTPSVLADKLDYTRMTMTRAFQELQAAGVGEFNQEGRERYWTFSDKHTLWGQAKPFLSNPIKKRTWLKIHSFKTSAGLSALSHFSQLAPPQIPVFAIGLKQWGNLKNSGIKELQTADEASLELEIWNYNPGLFAKDGFVDPLSLYFSLEASEDERVESALEEMMEKVEW